MRTAKKRAGRRVRAYELGAGSAMEQALLDEGRINYEGDGKYRVFSLETVNGEGAIGNAGDFIKVEEVDGGRFPYVNARSWFLANHKHIDGDEYEQIVKPVKVWMYGDAIGPEIRYIIDSGLLAKMLNMMFANDQRPDVDNDALEFMHLAVGEEATIIFYSVDHNEDGEIIGADFNFIRRDIFERDYVLCDEESFETAGSGDCIFLETLTA